MKKMIKRKLELKLEEIKEVLLFETNDININSGLMNGKAGEILFLLNYSSFKNDKTVLNRSLGLLEKLIYHLNFDNYTFCNGYAGVGWLVEHVVKNNYAEIDINELLFDVDKFIYDKMVLDINRGNYDYLHGAIGGGLYFLNRTESKIRKKALSILTKEIIKIGNEGENYITWDFFNVLNQKVEKGNYNLGLSHGIPSILYFLSKVNQDYKTPNNVIQVLNKGIDFLLSSQKDCEFFGSLFTCSFDENFPSRLAWCYGDLGISILLIQLGKELNRPELKKRAEIILDFNCSRLDSSRNGMFDAGFCHGTSGVAYIYKQAYNIFGKEEYLKISDFWYNETLKFATFEGGLAGYKSFNPKKNEFINNRSFLEGIAGIGLSIIGCLSEKSNNSWDNALLIS